MTEVVAATPSALPFLFGARGVLSTIIATNRKIVSSLMTHTMLVISHGTFGIAHALLIYLHGPKEKLGRFLHKDRNEHLFFKFYKSF